MNAAFFMSFDYWFQEDNAALKRSNKKKQLDVLELFYAAVV